MPFEQIELASPVVIPATEEKTFPIGWLETFQARVTSDTEGTAYYELRAYSQDGIKHPSASVERHVSDLWELAKEVPSVGVAIAALVTAVKDTEAHFAKLKEAEQE